MIKNKLIENADTYKDFTWYVKLVGLQWTTDSE